MSEAQTGPVSGKGERPDETKVYLIVLWETLQDEAIC
jgi:hypothetical protein